MISAEERRYLFWLGASFWKGQGHVVEMGPWLGGSTICLAAGMKKGARDGARRLHVYDSFVWRAFMAKRCSLDLAVGDSFEPFFLENLKDYRDLLTVSRSSLPDEQVETDSAAKALREESSGPKERVHWPQGEPIEILFVDGAKSWSGFRELLTTFGPSLIAGQSLLVLQDFKYWGTFWIAAITEILSESLKLEHILNRNTVTFRVVSPLDVQTLAAIPEWSDLDSEECARLVESAARRLDSGGDAAGAVIVRLSRVRMWLHKGSTQRALEEFRTSEGKWPLSGPDRQLEAVRSWLQSQTGVALPPAFRTRARRAVFGSLQSLLRLIRRLTR